MESVAAASAAHFNSGVVASDYLEHSRVWCEHFKVISQLFSSGAWRMCVGVGWGDFFMCRTKHVADFFMCRTRHVADFFMCRTRHVADFFISRTVETGTVVSSITKQGRTGVCSVMFWRRCAAVNGLSSPLISTAPHICLSALPQSVLIFFVLKLCQ